MSHEWKVDDRFRIRDDRECLDDFRDQILTVKEVFNTGDPFSPCVTFDFPRNPSWKDIRAKSGDIEYVPHRPGETFRVREKFRLAVSEEILGKTWTIEKYISGLVYFDGSERTISLECIESADSATQPCHKCRCDVMLLMARGCQCGGQ